MRGPDAGGMSESPRSAVERDSDSLVHSWTDLAQHQRVGAVVMTRGHGISVYDETGKEYIEALSGMWCASFGFGEDALVEAATTQMRRLPYYHTYFGKSSNRSVELAERLKQIAPGDFARVFLATSGSEANDSAIKLSWLFNNVRGRPTKKKLIARENAYHGATIGAASLTGVAKAHLDFDLPLPNVLHTDCPYFYRDGEVGESEEAFAARKVDELHRLIVDQGPETIAAFVAEPVMCAAGIILPPATYFDRVQALLKRYDILFVVDEVICGFGRTGRMFACETFDLRPDMLVLAKGLSAGYMPLSALMISSDIWDAMLERSATTGGFWHGFTHSGHPVAAAVALRVIDLMAERRTLEHVQTVSSRFRERLQGFCDHPLVGDVRVVGLLGAVELVADKASKTPFSPEGRVGAYCMDRCMASGLIVRAMNDSVGFAPPLVITVEEIDEMFDRFARALEQTAAMVSQGSLA